MREGAGKAANAPTMLARMATAAETAIPVAVLATEVRAKYNVCVVARDKKHTR